MKAYNLTHVKQIFEDHLEAKGLRKTPERFAILEEICNRSDHFEVESLYVQMKENSYRVSRATVYNTLNLLMECELVRKHQFQNGQALYEHSFAYKQHDHLICSDCGHVEEFCDPRLQEIQDDMGELLDMEIREHSLNFYANCMILKREGSCTKNQKNQ